MLAGLEHGGIPLATALSQLTGFPTAFVRKQPKAYGTRSWPRGPGRWQSASSVVEDVMTSGGQVVESTQELRAPGARSTAVVCVIDRESGGRENLSDTGVTLHAAFTMSELSAAAAVAG